MFWSHTQRPIGIQKPETSYINLPRFAGIPEFREFLLCPGALSTKSKKADSRSVFLTPGILMRGRSQTGGDNAKSKS